MATIKDRYVLDVDTKSGVRELEALNKKVGALQSGFGGLKTAAGAAVGALAGAGALNLAGNAVETYTAYENLTTQIATYTGGLENARTELDRLEKLSVKLPQDLNDLSEAFTILTRNGIDTSSAGLGKLSEIAAANGKSMTQLAEAVADGMTGEFERFKEFGIKVTKEGDNMVARIGDQQVAVSDSSTKLIEQLIELGAEGGKFFGAGAANAETLSQSFSNLDGAVSIIQRSFVDGLKPGLKSVVESFTNLATDNQDLMRDFGEAVGGVLKQLPGAFKAVADMVAPLKPLFELLGPVVRDLIIPVLKGVFEVVGNLAKALTPVVETLVPGLKTAFEAIVEIVNKVIAAFGKVIESLGNIGEKVGELTGAVSSKFSDMKNSIVDSAKEAGAGVKGWFDDMYDYVVGNSVVPDMVDGVVGEFDRLNHGMVSKVGEGVNATNNAFYSLAQSVGTNLNNYANISMSQIGGMIDRVTDGMYSKLENVVRTVDNTVSRVKRSYSRGGLGGVIKDTFLRGLGIPGFANGGYLPAGQLGVVGERQPELIMGPASIRPSANGAGGAMNVTINAVDAMSFKQLVASDPEFIYAVAQRGSRSFR